MRSSLYCGPGASSNLRGKSRCPRIARRSTISPPANSSKCQFSLFTLIRRLVDRTGRQQQTQRTLLDWLRVEYGIAKPSNKLLAPTDLDSNTWVSEVKRIRGK